MSSSTSSNSSGGGGGSSNWQTATQTLIRPKMDVAKALAILGFTSSRTLDHDARSELNAALNRQMELIERKRLRASSLKAAPSLGGQSAEEKQRDDVRILHEAYQFLSRKYLAASNKEEDEEERTAAAQNTMML